MCLLLDVMCPKTKTKSKTSSTKMSTKHGCRCRTCTMREIAKDEISKCYPLPVPAPPMNQALVGYNYSHGYSYGDWATWEDNNPATISNKQWQDHVQTARNAYDSSQQSGKKISEAKNALESEIKEAQKAIKETHASVKSSAKETREAVDLAHKSTHMALKEAQLAILKTQDMVHEKYAEHMSKQAACAADVARVRQLVEEDARKREAETKKREEARKMDDMIQYARSQGLLLAADQGRHRHSRSPSSSPSTDGEGVGGRRPPWEAVQRERLWRDLYPYHPRCHGMCYDDAIEALPYNTYAYAEYGGTGGGSAYRSAPRGRLPRRRH
ncbi:hypothetical protein F4802DRAFT_162359 [Xylaria palmicola]|nr:hypothetical protein F4802DRAFT_162359 [Xylaria palmicola]